MSPYIFHIVHRTITPASPQAGAPVPAGQPRRDVGEGPRGQLGVGHVIQPLGEERRDVAVVAGGAGEDLGVAQPAEPFVALRAVGGTLMKLPRWPQSMARNSWSSHGTEDSRPPVAGMSEWTTRAVMSAWAMSPG